MLKALVHLSHNASASLSFEERWKGVMEGENRTGHADHFSWLQHSIFFFIPAASMFPTTIPVAAERPATQQTGLCKCTNISGRGLSALLFSSING
jgi:hypothetical protein